MNIIIPTYEIIEQDNSLEGMFKHIEKCGRTCYRSEDKITNTSYKNFINMLENNEHGAMLEHGTIYLTIPIGTPIDDIQYIWKMDIVKYFQNNKYSIVKEKTINKIDIEIKDFGTKPQVSTNFYFITTNWRVIFEAQDKKIIKYFLNNYHIDTENLNDSILQWMTKPTKYHEKRYTVRFTYHLAVARDINRHRVQSIGEESTRYCNYSKEKFSEGPQAELNIIEPIFLSDSEKNIIHNDHEHLSFIDMCSHISSNLDRASFEAIDYWIFANKACEYAYMNLTKNFSWTPQQASLILPLDTKTCSVHTAFASDWCHFCALRALGTTGAPRPSAKEVAWPLMEEFIKRGYIQLNDELQNKYNEIKNKYPNIIDYIKK